MSFLKGNKNQKKRVLSVVGLVFLIVAVFAGIVLVQQNQDIREDAAGGCKYQTDRASCESSCVPKSNGESYSCRWGKSGCVETSNLCGGGQGQGSSTCSQLGGTCMGRDSGICYKNYTQTSDCGTQAYCCYGTETIDCVEGIEKITYCGVGLFNCKKTMIQTCEGGHFVTTKSCKCRID